MASLVQMKQSNKSRSVWNDKIINLHLGSGLRGVDLEPSSMKGSDKINMLKQGRNTLKKASHIPQPRLTYGSQHLER